MAELDNVKRAKLPDSAFAYVDSKGRRRLPINDESHVRNALARFNQTAFEDEAARDRARKRLLAAAKKYGIVPVGFFAGQLRVQGNQAAAGRLVLEIGPVENLETLQGRLRSELRDPTVEAVRVVGVAGRLPRRRRPSRRDAGGGHGSSSDPHRPPRPTDDRAGPRSGHAGGSRTSSGGLLRRPDGGREPAAAGDGRRRRPRRAEPALGTGDLPDDRHRGLDRHPPPPRATITADC